MACDKAIPITARPENIHAWLNTVKEYGQRKGKRRVTERDRETSKDRIGMNGVVRIDEAIELDNGRIPITRWETVKPEFGKIEGDERIIREKWEDLEKSLLPFIYWLIK